MAFTVRIDCEHCGKEATRHHPSARYCELCSTLRGALAMREYPAKCIGCDARFFRAHRKQRLCRLCSPSAGRVPRVSRPFRDDVTCRICDTAAYDQLHPRVRVCVGCVQSTEPARSSKVTKGLARKFRELAQPVPA